MQLTPADAVALPTIIQIASDKTGVPQDLIMKRCGNNIEMRNYLAGICRQAVKDAQ
jgi:hypothetical protein